MKLVNLTKNLSVSRRLGLRVAATQTGLHTYVRTAWIGASGRHAGFHSYVRAAFDTLDGFLLNKQVPKGFGKFYPEGESSTGVEQRTGASTPGTNEKTGTAEKSASATGTNKFNTKKKDANKKSGGGSGGGNKPPEFNMNTAGIMLLISLTLVLYNFNNKNVGKGQEISWKDFETQLLSSGQVDKVIIANKRYAKISLKKHVEIDQNKTNDYMGSQGLQSDRLSNDNAYMEPGWSDQIKNDEELNRLQRNSSANDNSILDSLKKYSRPNQQPPSKVGYTPYYFNIGSVESFEKKLEDAQKSLGIESRDYIPVMYVEESNLLSEFIGFLPNLILIGAYFMLMRGSGGGVGGAGGSNIFSVGKTNAKMIQKEMVTVTFADVAGCDEAKKEIMEFVEFLKNPKKFTDLGAKIPKGALICGPPGTGKTLLAKATAGEANVPFFSLAGSDFVEMFVGVGPSRVRDLFKQARANSPCIIFIDEIDAVGRKRQKGGFSGGNDERESTLNQLLVEMDGFDPNSSIVVLAGTNRLDILDSALLRPGRFDRKITVENPDIKGRKAIFDVHLRDINLADKIETYSSRLAALTPGFSGADIANICNEAAILAARRNKTKVELVDFESATDRVIGGLASNKIMTPEERRIIAYHEAGHAIAGWNLEYADPLLKVTIVPRDSGALGFAQYLPKEIALRTREQILDIVCMALAGRAAEQVTFGKVTTGASDDLRKVTQIVYQMVQVYGMNDKVGQMSFPREEGAFGQSDRLYSEATAEVIDTEVRSIIDEAYARTLALVTDKKEQIRLVAELLLEKETITNMDITKLIGARPYSAGKAYEQYVENAWGAESLDAPKDESAPETPSAATPLVA